LACAFRLQTLDQETEMADQGLPLANCAARHLHPVPRSEYVLWRQRATDVKANNSCETGWLPWLTFACSCVLCCWAEQLPPSYSEATRPVNWQIKESREVLDMAWSGFTLLLSWRHVELLLQSLRDGWENRRDWRMGVWISDCFTVPWTWLCLVAADHQWVVAGLGVGS